MESKTGFGLRVFHVSESKTRFGQFDLEV